MQTERHADTGTRKQRVREGDARKHAQTQTHGHAGTHPCHSGAQHGIRLDRRMHVLVRVLHMTYSPASRAATWPRRGTVPGGATADPRPEGAPRRACLPGSPESQSEETRKEHPIRAQRSHVRWMKLSISVCITHLVVITATLGPCDWISYVTIHQPFVIEIKGRTWMLASSAELIDIIDTQLSTRVALLQSLRRLLGSTRGARQLHVECVLAMETKVVSG